MAAHPTISAKPGSTPARALGNSPFKKEGRKEEIYYTEVSPEITLIVFKEGKMGYRASGEGYITVKESNRDKAFEVLKSCEAFEFYPSTDKIKDNVIISFYHPSDNYHDDFVKVLNDHKDLFIDGAIEFNGEDNGNWAFVFEKENGFVERNGLVIYENDECYIVTTGNEAKCFSALYSAQNYMKKQDDASLTIARFTF